MGVSRHVQTIFQLYHAEDSLVEETGENLHQVTNKLYHIDFERWEKNS